jgi:hypothetical protein
MAITEEEFKTKYNIKVTDQFLSQITKLANLTKSKERNKGLNDFLMSGDFKNSVNTFLKTLDKKKHKDFLQDFNIILDKSMVKFTQKERDNFRGRFFEETKAQIKELNNLEKVATAEQKPEVAKQKPEVAKLLDKATIKEATAEQKPEVAELLDKATIKEATAEQKPEVAKLLDKATIKEAAEIKKSLWTQITQDKLGIADRGIIKELTKDRGIIKELTKDRGIITYIKNKTYMKNKINPRNEGPSR